MKFNLIKSVRKFIADAKRAIDDPYICASEEGKQMWREIEELEKQNQNIANSGENENQSSE